MCKLVKTRKALAQELHVIQQQCNSLKEFCHRQEIELNSAKDALDTQNLILSSFENFQEEVLVYSSDTEYQYTSFNQKHACEMKLVWKITNKRPRRRATKVSILI
jgi:hypothetical protein